MRRPLRFPPFLHWWSPSCPPPPSYPRALDIHDAKNRSASKPSSPLGSSSSLLSSPPPKRRIGGGGQRRHAEEASIVSVVADGGWRRKVGRTMNFSPSPLAHHCHPSLVRRTLSSVPASPLLPLVYHLRRRRLFRRHRPLPWPIVARRRIETPSMSSFFDITMDIVIFVPLLIWLLSPSLAGLPILRGDPWECRNPWRKKQAAGGLFTPSTTHHADFTIFQSLVRPILL